MRQKLQDILTGTRARGKAGREVFSDSPADRHEHIVFRRSERVFTPIRVGDDIGFYSLDNSHELRDIKHAFFLERRF
jgi:hypothetical protein